MLSLPGDCMVRVGSVYQHEAFPSPLTRLFTRRRIIIALMHIRLMSGRRVLNLLISKTGWRPSLSVWRPIVTPLEPLKIFGGSCTQALCDRLLELQVRGM